MSLLARLTRPRRAEPDMRPLWHRVVEIAREKPWYADALVADTVPGRFDAITMVLALVLLRMERVEALRAPAARLTELFVSDMDGQLRQGGVGDLVVGKHVGRLMSTLGGRLGALREALAPSDVGARDAGSDLALMEGAVSRNVTLLEGAGPGRMAAMLEALARDLDATGDEDLLAGRIAR